MSEQKRCPECSCETEKAQCGCAVEIKAETYNDSSSVEQDVNRCGMKIEFLNLTTKSELMCEFQKACEAMNNVLVSDDNVFSVSEEPGNELCILLKTKNWKNYFFNFRKYRPDPVAPAKGRTVISRSGRLWVSAGVIHGDSLLVFDYRKKDCMDYLPQWCDYFNRDHHSPGWCEEWEPSE